MKGLSLRLKLILSTSLIISVTVSFIMIAVSKQVKFKIETDIQSGFKEKAELFSRIQEIRSRQLVQTAILLADAPALRAAVSTQDAQTVTQKLREEFRHLLDFDPIIPDSLIPQSYFNNADSAGLLVVCNPSGIVLGQMSSIPASKFSIAERPGLKSALNGDYVKTPSIWKVSGRYYSVISVPIYSAETIIGTITYGFPFHKLEATQLANDVDCEISFFIDSKLITSSFDRLTENETTKLSQEINSTAYLVKKMGKSQHFSHDLHDENWQIYVSPIKLFKGDDQINAYYVIASSYTDRIKALTKLQSSIIIFGLIGLCFSILVSSVFASFISKPIKLLVSGIDRMEKGDYSNPVPVTTKDELGLLTVTFNQLLVALKERLEILKFVSNATIDAIKKNSSNREIGGQRKDLTLFFSDIRGFTNWSEKRSPEDVISMLNHTLSFQVAIIKKHGGDVDKFVGDEMVAVFEGVKKDYRAICAAKEIQLKAIEILTAEAGFEVSIGIGINSGIVVMGAMGSDDRLDYTVIGNHVNLAARLCSAAGPKQIILSENTARNLDRSIGLTKLESIIVKGIEDPVEIYSANY